MVGSFTRRERVDGLITGGMFQRWNALYDDAVVQLRGGEGVD